MKKPLVSAILFLLFVNCYNGREMLHTVHDELTVFQYPKEPTSYRMKSPLPQIFPSISVAAVGDMMFGGHASFYIEKYGVSYPFDSTKKMLSLADVALGNLEGPFTDDGKKYDKKFNFKVPPEYANGLLDAGFDVLTLANNHMLDYGIEGLKSTLDVLDSLGVAHCGAGLNLSDAEKLAIIERNGYRIATLGYSMTFPREFWATDSTGGTCYPVWNKMIANIEKSDSLADFVIVTFHWGSELKNQPKTYQKDFAHAAIDAGADLVIGHHPHVLQGIEIYKNRLIAYSLGNFSFASYSKKATESIILKTYLTKEGLLFAKAVPILVNNHQVAFQPRPVKGAVADSIISHLIKFSDALNAGQVIDKSGYIWNRLQFPPFKREKIVVTE